MEEQEQEQQLRKFLEQLLTGEQSRDTLCRMENELRQWMGFTESDPSAEVAKEIEQALCRASKEAMKLFYNQSQSQSQNVNLVDAPRKKGSLEFQTCSHFHVFVSCAPQLTYRPSSCYHRK
jgi:hypothetical protein